MKVKSFMTLALGAILWTSCSDSSSTTEETTETETVEAVNVTKETFCQGGRTCWNLTAGPSMFGTNVCFNDNGTANMGEGFGPYKVENNTLSLSDNNGIAISSGTTLTFDVKSADEKSFVLLSNDQEMVFEKQ